MTIKTFIIETFLKRSDSRSFTEWFRVVNTSGDGMMTLDEWLIAMSHSKSESVLQSRGVFIVESRVTQTCKTEEALFRHRFGLLQERAKHRRDHRANTALKNQL